MQPSRAVVPEATVSYTKAVVEEAWEDWEGASVGEGCWGGELTGAGEVGRN